MVMLAACVANAQHKTHTVRQGENIAELAIKYKVRRAQIIEANPALKDPAKLKLGMKLIIPKKEASTKVAFGPHMPATKQTPASKINTKNAVVAADSSLIRRGPSTASGKVTLVDKGTKVVVLGAKDGWYKLKFPKGTVGWMRGDLLKPVAAPVIVAKKAPAKATVVAKKAPAKATVVAKKAPTAKVVVAKAAPAQKAAAKPVLVASNAKSGPVATKLLDKAYALRGTRYRYGGTSRGGFDCSGFVGTVFKTQGIKLPRTSRSMSRVGSSVTKKNLQPGDLVFFATRGRSVGHVGIYAGNGRFIHSSSSRSGGVKVSSLSEKYYSKRFAGAKRVMKSGKPTVVASATPSKAASVTAPVVARRQSVAIEEKVREPMVRGPIRIVSEEADH